jgi:hypothetical protein
VLLVRPIEGNALYVAPCERTADSLEYPDKLLVWRRVVALPRRPGADVRVRPRPATGADGHERLLWDSVPFTRSRALRTTSGAFPLSPSPQGEVNPTSTDALLSSMKAPVRVADVDVGGCRRGALRGGEQRLAFDAGEELGGSDFEF